MHHHAPTRPDCAIQPERLQPATPGKDTRDERCDVWSLGMSLVELADLAYPFKFNCEFDMMMGITQGAAHSLTYPSITC